MGSHAGLKHGPVEVAQQRGLEARHVVLEQVDELQELVLPVRDRGELPRREACAQFIANLDWSRRVSPRAEAAS